MSEKIFYVRMDEKDYNRLLDEFKTSDLTIAIKKMADKCDILEKKYSMVLKYTPQFD